MAALPLRAAEVLDQQNDLTGSAAADSTSGGFQEVAQTFTVGVTGTLTRIEVQIVRFFGSGGDAILSVYNTSGGFPAGDSLGSRTLAWNLYPDHGIRLPGLRLQLGVDPRDCRHRDGLWCLQHDGKRHGRFAQLVRHEHVRGR